MFANLTSRKVLMKSYNIDFFWGAIIDLNDLKGAAKAKCLRSPDLEGIMFLTGVQFVIGMKYSFNNGIQNYNEKP